MLRKGKMFQKIILFALAGSLLASCAVLPDSSTGSSSAGYQMITVNDLQGIMDAEDFTFVNVHIPLEGNIPGTDAQIPFDDIENHLNLLPANKDEKIVVYCRSGSMGNTASQTLIDLGYSDVSNLEGGYIAWKAAGLPFEE